MRAPTRRRRGWCWLAVRCLDRQSKEERAADADLAFDADVSPVRLHDAARDVETEPRALATLDSAGPMALENVRELVLRDARAGVGDRNSDVAVLRLGGETNLASFAA